jgi:hypothetical protein
LLEENENETETGSAAVHTYFTVPPCCGSRERHAL